MTEDDTKAFAVLINEAGQHALQPAALVMPDGWRTTGFTGIESECVRYVDEHWTDLRPRPDNGR